MMAQKSWYARNRDKVLTKLREKYLNDSEFREKAKAKAKAWNKDEQNRKPILEKYNNKNKHKIKTRQYTNNAIRDGRLERLSCEVCGKVPSEAHHLSYEVANKVQFLCTAHHAAWHKVFILSSLFLLIRCSPNGHFSVHEENDILNYVTKNQDKYYTQGTKLTYTLPESGTKVDSIAVGNNIFTPEHKHTKELLPNDRPYAGYSYAEFARRSYEEDNVETKYALQAGLIGPGSGGKFFQCGVHKLIGEACPEGWANQLKDEPTLLLQAEQQRKTPLQSLLNLNFDAIGKYGAEIGNVSTLARLGGTIRIGLFDGRDFGPSLIFPRIDRFAVPELWQLYFFTGTEGRAIVRNIFLDGNTFENSARVTKEPFVADFKGGFSLSRGEFRITYSLVFITNEWQEKNSSQEFGAVDISWGW